MIVCYELALAHPRDRGEWLFDSVSFEVPTGGWVEFVGPSGSGKSTLFDFMTLRAKPTCGKLLLSGRQVARSSAKQLGHLRRRIGACAQSPLFLPGRSVAENLVLPLLARGERAQDTSGQVAGALELWGLEKLATLEVRALTHSERQVVGVMRACIGSPALVVLDEPFEGVEGLWRNRICQNLRRLQTTEGTTVVVLGKETVATRKGWSSEIRLEQGKLHLVEHMLHPPSPESIGVYR